MTMIMSCDVSTNQFTHHDKTGYLLKNILQFSMTKFEVSGLKKRNYLPTPDLTIVG